MRNIAKAYKALSCFHYSRYWYERFDTVTILNLPLDKTTNAQLLTWNYWNFRDLKVYLYFIFNCCLNYLVVTTNFYSDLSLQQNNLINSILFFSICLVQARIHIKTIEIIKRNIIVVQELVFIQSVRASPMCRNLIMNLRAGYLVHTGIERDILGRLVLNYLKRIVLEYENWF